MECNKCKADCANCKTIELLKQIIKDQAERFRLQIENEFPVKYNDIPIKTTPN